MNRTDRNLKENTVLYPVPMLGPERKVPAYIHSIALIKSSDDQDTIRIIVKRELSVSIKSFSFRYRFSALPIYAPDAEHKFSVYLYDEDDINSNEFITITGTVPSRFTSNGCSAYISEIALSSGQVITFDSSEFRWVRRPKASTTPSVPKPYAGGTTHIESSADGEKAVTTKKKAKLSPEKKRRRLIVIVSSLLAMFVVEIFAGIALYRYFGVKNSADMLIKDNRFNEAYKIAYDSEYESVLQRVCEKAMEYYVSKNDLQTAYVYAAGAPGTELSDIIIDYAAASVIDIGTGKINETAFLVAKMSKNDEKFTSIIRSICDTLMNRGDYANALRMASEIRNPNIRSDYENTVFEDALNYYISNHKYDETAAFIEELVNIQTFEISKEDALDAAFNCCVMLDDNAGIIHLSRRYPDHAEITSLKAGTSAGDAGVRTELSIIYPMLTDEQKRAYHAQSVSVWNGEMRYIQAGKIVGTNISDAVSIDTNEKLTLVLKNNGSVTAIPLKGETVPYTIPAYKDIVQITLGKEHAVLLHSNGTVSALGDNTYGQCDVSEWSDIVAIAAGQRFTVGLKIDGTVVATGQNSCGQCDVSPYRNVVDVSACNQTTVMLFSDGTVMITGFRSFGLNAVENVSGVTRIRAGAAAILVEKQNNTYELFSANIGGSYGDVHNWSNIDAFDVGVVCIAGIDKNGTPYQSGDNIPNKK